MRPISLVAGLVACWPGAQALSNGLRTWEFRKMTEAVEENTSLSTRDLQKRADYPPTKLYPAYNLSVPVDHFHNDSSYEPHSDEFFNLRYWFDASHYRPGGPVIILAAGETSGVGRLVFLQKGILAQLAQATGGVGVVLEHRYYGTSVPTADLSTESLRFLTTDQALADTAYFAKNVRFAGLEDVDFSPDKTPWIAYGGSYAGSFVAFLRKLYPEAYWGAIASSGVTEAIYDYWEYYEAHRLYAPPACVDATQKLTHVVDNILIGQNGTEFVAELKEVFGLGNITHDDDFANIISIGIAGLQGENWDPAVNDPDFRYYCGNVSSDVLLYPALESKREKVAELIAVGGYKCQVGALVNRALNYIGYLGETLNCRDGLSQDQCFGNHNTTFYQQDDISQNWRLWAYQYCTQWGYLQTGSGVPATQLPLISRLIDLPYSTIVCREAFNITSPPDIAAINKHGGRNISYPRLAFVDGEADPWRAATPHAIGYNEDRASTLSEPFYLIGGNAVHHWDENGVFPNQTVAGVLPPPPVENAQRLLAVAVQGWLLEWELEHIPEVELKY